MPDVMYLRTTFNGAAVVAAPAEIDIVMAEQLRAVLLEAAAGEHPVVVVDMTRTLFCDSSGLHCLVRARKRIAAEGGDLRLVIPADGVVSRIIDLTGLGMVIPCFSTLAEAVAGSPASAVLGSQAEQGLPPREPRVRPWGGLVDTAS